MADTTTWLQLEPHLNRLVSLYESTRGEAASAYIAAEAWDGINARFTIASDLIRKLKPSGVYGLAVINGVDGAAARWAYNANTAGTTLQGILKDFAGENVWSRAWSEVVVQTAEDGKQLVVSTAGAVAAAAPGIAGTIVVVLVLLIILKVVK